MKNFVGNRQAYDFCSNVSPETECIVLVFTTVGPIRLFINTTIVRSLARTLILLKCL